jgi:hypothetical protein
MSAPLSALIAGAMAYRDWEDRRRTDSYLSPRDLVSDVWVTMRRDYGHRMDETEARHELTDAMVAAAVAAFHHWKQGHPDSVLSPRDLASDIWIAIRLAGGHPND